MPFCAAFGCNSQHKKDSGVSLFRFPKDAGRRKAWTIYCRREDFSPTDNNRLCSLHFSKEQLDRDPEKLKENGYAEPRIRLRKDAFPDIPLSVGKPQDENATISFPPRKPRGAYLKRQRAEVSCIFIIYLTLILKCTLSHHINEPNDLQSVYVNVLVMMYIRKCTCYDVHVLSKSVIN